MKKMLTIISLLSVSLTISLSVSAGVIENAIEQLNNSGSAQDTRSISQRMSDAKVLAESAAKLALEGIQYDCNEKRPDGSTVGFTIRVRTLK